MSIFEYKKKIEKKFLTHNIDKSEVNILFCEALGLDYTKLLSKTEITEQEKNLVEKALKRRLKGEPIQKIFKRAYFCDYQFFVNKNVLCPRPETELLVEECLKFANSKSKVLDLCTGSGAIAISLQKKLGTEVAGSDISPKALYVAKKNAKALGAKVKFIKSDMFENIKSKFDIIVSNPPYIPSRDIESLDREVKNYDPRISLDGGETGLDFYKIIAKNAKAHLTGNGKVLLEVGKGQAKKVKNMLEKVGFVCYIKKDYNNIDRIVVGELYDWKMW